MFSAGVIEATGVGLVLKEAPTLKEGAGDKQIAHDESKFIETLLAGNKDSVSLTQA